MKNVEVYIADKRDSACKCDWPCREWNIDPTPWFSFQTNGPTDGGGYAAIAQADKHRQEPEKIRIWREEQKKRLEQKGNVIMFFIEKSFV